MGNVAQTHVGSTKNVLNLPFYLSDLANANGTLHTGVTNVLKWTAPASGSIIGYSGYINAALTAGTITVHPTIDGSLCPAFSTPAALIVPEHEYGYVVQPARQVLYSFSAGAAIGGEFRASNTLDPETADGSFMILVLLEGVEY